MRRMLVALTVLAVTLAAAGPAAADDGDLRFHRTTPRADLDAANGVVVIGVPGGRAWGIESELRPLPPAGSLVVVRLAVTDDAVREAFVRLAYYASPTGRTRQLATVDSAPVAAGTRGLALVPIEPPPGAVAYRVRLLARLGDPAARSRPDAITARIRVTGPGGRPVGSLFSRLLP